MKAYPRGSALSKFVGPLVWGVPIGVIGVIVTGLSRRWSIVVFGGLLTLLPVLTVRNVKLYGLGLLLFLLLIEADAGKNLSGQIIDGNELMETLGIPAARSVGLMVRPSDVVFSALMLAWLLRILTKREGIRVSGFGWLALVYLGWATLSLMLKAPYRFLSVVELVQQAKYVLVFVYVANAVDKRVLVKGLIAVLMSCLFVQSVVTLASWKFPSIGDLFSLLSSPSVTTSNDPPPVAYETGSGQRALGTFKDYGVTAVYFHFLLPLALAKTFVNWGNRTKWWYLFLLAIGTPALWVTYSRAALLSAVFGLGSCLYLAYRRGFVSRLQVCVIAYTAVAATLILSPQLTRHFESRPALVEGRYHNWEEGWRLVTDNPVFGVGLNNSTAVRKESFIRTLEQDVREEGSQPIHNQYLVVASETGLVGLTLFMLFFLAIGRKAIRHSQSLNVETAALALGITGTLAALAVQLFFDPIASYRLFVMLFFYAGLVVAFGRLEAGAAGQGMARGGRSWPVAVKSR